jgi:hypothetical protein
MGFAWLMADFLKFLVGYTFHAAHDMASNSSGYVPRWFFQNFPVHGPII